MPQELFPLTLGLPEGALEAAPALIKLCLCVLPVRREDHREK
jgi:hypothetical protein